MAVDAPSRIYECKDAKGDVVYQGDLGPFWSIRAIRAGMRSKLIFFERTGSGEWLHPPGVEVLGRLGIDVAAEAVDATRGRGFVVFPDDGSNPIVLPYADGMQGISLEHESLVSLLRERATSHERIDLRLGARVRGIVDGSITVENADGRGGVATFEVDRVVGADGRSSVVRRALALKDDATAMAFTAGVELRDVLLPFEGYGHVLVGGLGPVLMYRIGPGRARACALYLALTRRDPSGIAVRQAVYRLWRASEDERGRTMRILACVDTRPEQFVGAFQAVFGIWCARTCCAVGARCRGC